MMGDEFLKLLDTTLPPKDHPLYQQYRDYSLQTIAKGKSLISFLNPRVELQNKKILDIGCGDGGVAVAFAKAGCKVTAIDPSPERALLTKIRAEEEGVLVEVLQKSAESLLPFPKASFDGALLADCLEYILQPDEVFKELDRLIKPGGFCYISVMNRLFWRKKFMQMKHKRFYFYSEIQNLLVRHHFEIKLSREALLKKIDQPDQILTPWRRAVFTLLKKFHFQKAVAWWIHSPFSPWFEARWEILGIKK